jgi:aminotransferase
MMNEYNMRRRMMVAGFNKIGLSCREPKGAFYAFPSIKSTGMTSEEFCEKLLYSKKVAVVPGTAFGESGEGYARISCAYSTSHIKKAIERITQFVKDLEK